MPQFFVPPHRIKGETFSLEVDEAHHLYTVLRKRPGDKFYLFDGQGNRFYVRIDSISSREVRGTILKEEPLEALPVTIRLFQGYPKGDKFDWVLEKATELGVSSVIPVYTERVVSKVPISRLDKRLDRWQKKILSAAKQAGRGTLLEVKKPVGLKDALNLCPDHHLILFPWESEEKITLKKVLKNPANKDKMRNIDVFIGPEGGFTPKESHQAQEKGAHIVSLGPNIFRTETAGLYMASILLYELTGVR